MVEALILNICKVLQLPSGTPQYFQLVLKGNRTTIRLKLPYRGI